MLSFHFKINSRDKPMMASVECRHQLYWKVSVIAKQVSTFNIASPYHVDHLHKDDFITSVVALHAL